MSERDAMRAQVEIRNEVAMIGRLWHGWTGDKDADAYEAFLRDELLPEASELPGCLGGYVLRRAEGAHSVEFTTLVLFESMEAVRAFAGDDYDVPVIEPAAMRLLARYDDRVAHYDAVVTPELLSRRRQDAPSPRPRLQ
jgi:hypothetical protein